MEFVEMYLPRPIFRHVSYGRGATWYKTLLLLDQTQETAFLVQIVPPVQGLWFLVCDFAAHRVVAHTCPRMVCSGHCNTANTANTSARNS
eukprot:1685783-Rhodomonas_salina.1